MQVMRSQEPRGILTIFYKTIITTSAQPLQEPGEEEAAAPRLPEEAGDGGAEEGEREQDCGEAQDGGAGPGAGLGIQESAQVRQGRGGQEDGGGRR